MDKSILTKFTDWFEEAKAAIAKDPNACCLSTAGEERLSSRIVLLKEYDAAGFVFYTNYESDKGLQLKNNPRAALNFYWREIDKQIRIEGAVEKVSAEQSDAYFASRPRENQLSAAASAQSRELDGYDTYLAKIDALDKQYDDQPIPRPEHWGGYRLVPSRIEFWHQLPHRRHDRMVYTKHGDDWTKKTLYP